MQERTGFSDPTPSQRLRVSLLCLHNSYHSEQQYGEWHEQQQQQPLKARHCHDS